VQRPIAIAVGAVAAVIVGVVIYWQFIAGEAEPPPAAPPPVSTPVEAAPPVVAEPRSIVVPPLESSDAPLRAMIEGLSAHPRLADVLATDQLARTFVIVVVAIANGESPREALGYLEPEASFAIAERDGSVVIDPASFERYTWITGVFSSLDAAGAAELYRQLEPLFEEAYRDIGYPEGPFRPVLDAALDQLASTLVPEGYIEVRRGTVLWEFRDPGLERLNPAQKQLLRMGPANARLVQAKIRELQAALGR